GTSRRKDGRGRRGSAWPRASEKRRAEAPIAEDPSRGVTVSGGNDVLGLRALLALGDVEGHLLALVQLAVAAGGDDVRVVGEDVGAAAVLLDEAESLFRVEPLHGAGSHGDLLLLGAKPKSAPCGFRVADIGPHPEKTGKQKMHLRIRTVRCTQVFIDRKSTRLNSSHVKISYAVFCLK